jgi:hypothetical protein
MGFFGSILSAVGTVGGALVGGPVGAAIGAGIGGIGEAVQEDAAADKANDRTVDNYRHKHQWEVEDLKAAGLNPILSANNAGSVGTMAKANVPQQHSALAEVAAKKQLKILDQQLRKISAEANSAERDAWLKTSEVVYNNLPMKEIEGQIKTGYADMFTVSKWLDYQTRIGQLNSVNSSTNYNNLRITQERPVAELMDSLGREGAMYKQALPLLLKLLSR